MAGRSEARIFASIWKDKAFRALPRSAQGMYMFLLSQPDLSYCGVIALREPRWARHAEGLTIEDVRADLECLAKPFIEPFGDGSSGEAHQPFVVIDEESGELLVRTLIRNDGIWKQPNLLKAARDAADLVDSPRIRAALLEELERLPVEESSSNLVKSVLADFMNDLKQGWAEGPVDPSPKGSGGSSSDPSQGKGEGNGSYQQEPHSPSDPCPKPPTAPSAGADAPGEGGELVLVAEIPPPAKPKRKTTKRKANRTAEDDLADELTNGYWDLYGKDQAKEWIAVRQRILAALKNGNHRDEVAWALDALGRRSMPITANTLTIALGQVKAARQQGRDVSAPGVVDHKQQATNDLFERALARAAAREEAS